MEKVIHMETPSISKQLEVMFAFNDAAPGRKSIYPAAMLIYCSDEEFIKFYNSDMSFMGDSATLEKVNERIKQLKLS